MNQFISITCLLFISLFSFAQSTAVEIDADQLNTWIQQSIDAGEFYENQKEFVAAELKDFQEHQDDANRVYDLGRALHQGLQQALQSEKNVYRPATYSLIEKAEELYLAAIASYPGFGRANAMLGMLYNQQYEYDSSPKYLEVALGMEEGSEDWMVAANQYLLAGAETGHAQEPSYQKVYKQFKQHAPMSSQSYYQKMADLYVPYFEK